ncbi:hypothetical protein P4S72_29060 [Vibrio sp. PP-XX7]
MTSSAALPSLALGVGVLQIVLDKGNELDWFNDHWILAGAIFAAVPLAIYGDMGTDGRSSCDGFAVVCQP